MRRLYDMWLFDTNMFVSVSALPAKSRRIGQSSLCLFQIYYHGFSFQSKVIRKLQGLWDTRKKASMVLADTRHHLEKAKADFSNLFQICIDWRWCTPRNRSGLCNCKQIMESDLFYPCSWLTHRQKSENSLCETRCHQDPSGVMMRNDLLQPSTNST